MKWLRKILNGNWFAVCLISISSCLIALASVIQTLAVKNFVDSAVTGSRQGFFHWLLIFFLLIFFQLIGGALRNLYQEATVTSINNEMKQKCFHNILTREYKAIGPYHSGDFMQRIMGDCEVVVGNSFWIIPQVCTLVTKLVAAVCCLVLLDWRLTLILLACFFLMLGVAVPLRGIIRQYHRRVMEASGEVRSVLQEVLDNHLVVRSFQAVEGVEDKASNRLQHYRKRKIQSSILSQAMNSASSTAINMVYLIGLIWCGLGIINGTISYGTLYAIWELVGKITGPAMQASGILPQYYAMTSSAERLEELEKLPEEIMDCTCDWQMAGDQFTHICCKNVTFSYDNKNLEQTTILKNLDFTIKRGDFVAITGESGIGKSTFLKLLLGIYAANDAGIHVQCRDGQRFPLDAGARAMISYVPQGNFLMSGTIRETVHFWQKETIDEQKLLEACRVAEAGGFLSELEQGLDTQIGERGAGLSEGQLQRLAIARAVYSDKPVLLLDEATSALDEETEAKVLKNLKLLKNRTVIIVTHRKAALDICNRIALMGNRKLIEVHKNETSM